MVGFLVTKVEPESALIVVSLFGPRVTGLKICTLGASRGETKLSQVGHGDPEIDLRNVFLGDWSIWNWFGGIWTVGIDMWIYLFINLTGWIGGSAGAEAMWGTSYGKDSF